MGGVFRRRSGLIVAPPFHSACSPERTIVPKSQNIATRATRQVKWVALTEVVTKAALPLTAVVLARLLSPIEYGLVSIAVMTNTVAQMLWDAGLSRMLIQTKDADDETVNAAFWINFGLAVALYGIVLVWAPCIASFLNAPEATPIVRVMGFAMILAALGSVHSALLTRALDFQRLFWLRLSSALVPVFVTIPLAIVGCGVWALVGGALAGQALNLGLLCRYSTWRPRSGVSWSSAANMVRSGSWYFGEGLLGWFWTNGDSFIVATFLNVHDLGLYRVGRSLVDLAFSTFLNPVLQLAYPAFSRLQDSRQTLSAAFSKANHMIVTVSLPLGVSAVLFGPTLVRTLYGSKWDGLGLVVAILGVWAALGWFVGLNSEVYRALGRPDITTKLNLVVVAYCVPAFILAAKHGVTAFAATRLLMSLVTLPIHMYLAHRLMRIPLVYLWDQSKSVLLASGGMAGVVLLINWVGETAFPAHPQWLALLVGLPVAVGAFGSLLLLLDRPFVVDTVNLGRRALGLGPT